MIETLSLSGFFLMGLLGGLGHCVGMCSPFVLIIADRFARPGAGAAKNLLPHIGYHLGRVLTYAVVGGAAGLLGSFVNLGGSLVGVQRAAALLAGALLLLYGGLALAGGAALQRFEDRMTTHRLVLRLLRRGTGGPLLLGLVLGLLPCGLSYGAFIAAAALGHAARGALGTALFGLGTVPALLALALAGNVLTTRRGLLYRASLVLVVLMGGLFVWRGVRG